MKALLEFIVKQIVTKPEAVVIEESNGAGFLNLKLKVAPEDYGVVIGKEGRSIRSIRELLRLKSLKENIRFNLTLEETGQQP